MPFPFMIRLMRRRDSATPSCPRACLIFPAPYTLPLSLHTRSTSFSQGSARSASGCSSIQWQVDLATPRILHCADIGQRPALDRITSTFVRIPAPLVLKHRPPSPAACCVSAIRSARSPRECGCRPLSWSRCYVSPAPNAAAWNAGCRTPP